MGEQLGPCWSKQLQPTFKLMETERFTSKNYFEATNKLNSFMRSQNNLNYYFKALYRKSNRSFTFQAQFS